MQPTQPPTGYETVGPGQKLKVLVEGTVHALAWSPSLEDWVPIEVKMDNRPHWSDKVLAAKTGDVGSFGPVR